MSSSVYCKEFLYCLRISVIMARPRGSSKATGPRHRCRQNVTSLSTDVLRLRLQALSLPKTGSEAELISRWKAAVEQPRPTKQPPPGRVKKSTSKKPSLLIATLLGGPTESMTRATTHRPLVLWMAWMRVVSATKRAARPETGCILRSPNGLEKWVSTKH